MSQEDLGGCIGKRAKPVTVDFAGQELKANRIEAVPALNVPELMRENGDQFGFRPHRAQQGPCHQDDTARKSHGVWRSVTDRVSAIGERLAGEGSEVLDERIEVGLVWIACDHLCVIARAKVVA